MARSTARVSASSEYCQTVGIQELPKADRWIIGPYPFSAVERGECRDTVDRKLGDHLWPLPPVDFLEHLLRYCVRPPFALDRLACGRQACRRRLLRRESKAQLARHLADRLGQTHGPGGGGVSARVPGVWWRHPDELPVIDIHNL